MMNGDSLPITTAVSSISANARKESAVYTLFGRGRYMFWVLAAILIFAFWSMFTSTVTLRLSYADLNRLHDDMATPLHYDPDVLELEEREKMVKRLWIVYTNNHGTGISRFWHEAFKAAYEDLTSDVPGIREAAITEIAKMSARFTVLDPPIVHSTG